jgi:hypothetical protein
VPHRLSLASLVRIALATSLSLCAALYFLWSWHWPLVGDASLIHYIALLIERGWSPYRDLGDMNMPGSYLVEMAAMRVIGMGDLAWRLFDFSLMVAAAAAFVVIARRKSVAASWLAALFSASLFTLVHGRDGLAEGGQRDLTMAVCLLVATAFLFVAVRRDSLWGAFVFGLFSGVALTIKPTALLLTVAQISLAAIALRHRDRGQSSRRYIAAAFAGYLVLPAIALVFLLREHAFAAFLAGFHGIVPYYASLGHRPLGFILLHSLSPLLPLVLIWIAMLVLTGFDWDWKNDWERTALLVGVLFGLINCIAQARALPYYRYPLLAFLLPVMALDFTRAAHPLQSFATLRSRSVRALAISALCFGGFFLAPQSALLVHRYRWWQTDFISSLQENLDSLGGQRLSGHIQCIDSISGCGNVLYRMRLEPATGVLSDFLLFGPDSVAIVRQTRANFLTAVEARPPQVIVVTSHLHMDGPDDFLKLDRWPAFQSFLAANYSLHTEWAPTRTARWWSREETPASYRIYLLRSHP